MLVARNKRIRTSRNGQPADSPLPAAASVPCSSSPSPPTSFRPPLPELRQRRRQYDCVFCRTGLGGPTRAGGAVVEAMALFAAREDFRRAGDKVRGGARRIHAVCGPRVRLAADAVVVLILNRAEAGVVIMIAGPVLIARVEEAVRGEAGERATREAGAGG